MQEREVWKSHRLAPMWSRNAFLARPDATELESHTTTCGDTNSEILSALRPTPPALGGEGGQRQAREIGDFVEMPIIDRSHHYPCTWRRHLNMRSAIQAALLRVQQHVQLHHGNDTPWLSATPLQVCSRSSVLSSAGVSVPDGTHGYISPDTQLALQLVDKPDPRGTINALACLIEQHGLEELQRVGVCSPEGVVGSQELTAIANAYGIPVHFAMPGGDDWDPGKGSGTSSGMNKPAPDSYKHPAVPVWHNAIRFPSRDQMDIIHGRGTVALELERDLAMLAQNPSTRSCGFKSSLDFVIADMDNGITLSGICMAFAGTRTQVIGAAPMSGFWEYAAKPHLPPGETQGHEYWEGVDVPMAAIPWATFRDPGHLAGVLEVDNEQIYAAMLAAREAYGLQLDSDEVVPLAVALCHEEFGRLVARAWDGGDEGPTVGIILRSRRGQRMVSVATEGC